MSETTVANDACASSAPPATPIENAEVLKTELAFYTTRMKEFLTKDIQAIPAEKQTVSPGGEGRAPLKMVAECARLNEVVAAYLGGREPQNIPREETAAYYATFDTEEKALTYLEKATAELVAEIEALDSATFFVVRKGFFGIPTTVHVDAGFPANHMMYHIGQLNYIHTLYGDTKIHWW